jgi:transposase
MHAFLTDAEILAIREARAAGIQAQRLAKAFHVHKATISKVCRGYLRRSLGGPLTQKARLSPSQVSEARKRFLAGEDTGSIGAAFGCSRNVINNKVADLRPEHSGRPKRLNAEQEAQLIRWYLDGEKWEWIAYELKVSLSLVGRRIREYRERTGK